MPCPRELPVQGIAIKYLQVSLSPYVNLTLSNALTSLPALSFNSCLKFLAQSSTIAPLRDKATCFAHLKRHNAYCSIKWWRYFPFIRVCLVTVLMIWYCSYHDFCLNNVKYFSQWWYYSWAAGRGISTGLRSYKCCNRAGKTLFHASYNIPSLGPCV